MAVEKIQMTAVERNKVIKGPEVVRRKLPATQAGNRIAAPSSHFLSSGIRRFAHMPAAGSDRVDEPVFSSPLYKITRISVRERRTTYIAGANKQDFHFNKEA